MAEEEETTSSTDNEVKAALIKVGEKAYEDVIAKGLAPAARLIGTIVNVFNSLLVPVEMLNNWADGFSRRQKEIIDAGVAAASNKGVTIDEKAIGRVIQATRDIPYDVDDELKKLWVSLITSAVEGQEYHPCYTKILAELSPTDAILLGCLEEMEKIGNPLSPNSLPISLDEHFYNSEGELDLVKLSVSLTSLERQSLISTANNLGAAYHNLINKKAPDHKKINPTGHQITALGAALLRVTK